MVFFSNILFVTTENQCLMELTLWSWMFMISKDLVWRYQCTMWMRYGRSRTSIGLVAYCYLLLTGILTYIPF